MASSESDSSCSSFSTAPDGANESPYSPSGHFRLGHPPAASSAPNELADSTVFDDVSLEDDDDDDDDEVPCEDLNETPVHEDISEGWDKIDPDEDVNYETIPEDMLAYLRRRDPEHVAFNEGAVHISSEGLNPDPEIADHWVVTGGGHRHQESYSFERDYPELAPLIRRVVENPASRPAREALLTALGRAGRLRESAENTIVPVVHLFRSIGQGLAEIAEETGNVINREYLQDLSARIQGSGFWRRY